MSAVPSETFADRSESDDSEADGISRFSRMECCGMLRVLDSAASAGVLGRSDTRDMAFPVVGTESARGTADFGAQWLACFTLSTDAQDDLVTAVAPPLEAEVMGSIFFVGLFHSLFQPGLSRRTPTPPKRPTEGLP